MSDKNSHDHVLNIIGMATGVVPTAANVATLSTFTKSNVSSSSATIPDRAMIYLYLQFLNQSNYIYRI